MAQLAAGSGHHPAQPRHQVGGNRGAVGMRGDPLSAERRLVRQPGVEIVGGIGDQLHRVLVAGPGAVSPADDPVAGQHHAFDTRVGRDIVTQHHAQRVARPLPAQPADLAAPDLPRRRFPARTGRQRDDGIRMDVVDMGKGQQRMQRGVDAGRAAIQVERAVRQVTHHFVVIVRAGIVLAEAQQLVLIQRREAVELHRADVPTRALDPQHLHCRAGQRIGFDQLGRGVAAAEIGHGQVRAEQVRAIQQQLCRRETGRNRLVPAAGGDGKRDRCGRNR